MKRTLLMILPLVMFALLGTACDRMGQPQQPAMAGISDVCGVPQQVILYAGQTINAGNVTVWNDQTDLYVQFSTSNGWLLGETHVAVATSLAGIPQKNGNPIPGQFPYKMNHNPPVGTYTYIIPLDNWQPGQQLYIAAHAVVVQLDQNGNVIRRETGWGNGPGFPGKNWATYIMYTVQPCTRPIGNLTGQFRTQTQGGWGAVPRGNNPGVYLHANFAGAFPSGAVMGDGYTLTLTSAQAVTDYLPDGGTPAPLTQNWVDPGSQFLSVLAGQVTALTLSVGFDLYDPNFGASPVNLRNLLVADNSSPYYGWTVQQVLDEGNRILGGGPGNAAQINQAVTLINQNFDNGNMDAGFLELP